MIKMKNCWQLNIFLIVLLVSLCYGGPVAPKLNITLSNSEDSSKNNDLSPISKTGEVTTTGTKLDEAKAQSVEPEVGSTKSVTNISNKANVITNYIAVEKNSTAASGKENASSPIAAINPSASAAVDAPSSDTSDVEQAKPEVDNQIAVVKENDTKAANNEATVTVNAEMENKAKESKVTIGSNESTKDEKDLSEVTVEDKQKESIVNDSQVLTNVDKPSETVLEVTKNDPEPDLPEENKVIGTEPEQSADSLSNTEIVKEEPTVDSESNKPTDNQETSANSEINTPTDNQPSSANSESNTQTDNQESSADLVSNTQTENQGTSADSESNAPSENQDPSVDVSNKSPAPVSVSKSTTTTTSSSFDIYIGGDSSASYPQSGDQDFSSFNGYNGNDNDASYDDEVGMNSVDNAPYDNERGAYKNEQQKLNGEFTDDTDSHFFAYFLTIMVSAIVFYLLFHNKQRIIALIIEGRASPRSRRGSGRTRYHKLDTNLEEAMVQTKGSTRFDGLY